MHGSASQPNLGINSNILTNENAEMHGSATQPNSGINNKMLTNENVEMHGSASPSISTKKYEVDQNSIQSIKSNDVVAKHSLLPKNQLLRKPKSISSFMGIFKSKVTVSINKLMNTKGFEVWQANYHDNIVRDYKQFKTIYYYIENNPKKWNEDKFNPINPK